jgi:hypothetical protein
VLVCALLAASATAIYLGQAGGTSRASGLARAVASTASGSSAYALTAATQVRERAAAWVAAQVGHGVIVACDPLMCADLLRRGFPAVNLEQIGPDATDPLGSGIVISTAPVRSQFAARLTTIWASQVIASFGTGADLVQILVAAPHGAATYWAAEQADLAARKTAGKDLLGNANVHALPAPARQLAAGLVDTRLLITLAALAHRYPLYIRGFGDDGPGASPGTPLRSAAIATTKPGYLRDMLAFLHAQRMPLLAQATEIRNGSITFVQVEFSAPSPIGLLAQN